MMHEPNYIRCSNYYVPDIRLSAENKPIGHRRQMHRDQVFSSSSKVFSASVIALKSTLYSSGMVSPPARRTP